MPKGISLKRLASCAWALLFAIAVAFPSVASQKNCGTIFYAINGRLVPEQTMLTESLEMETWSRTTALVFPADMDTLDTLLATGISKDAMMWDGLVPADIRRSDEARRVYGIGGSGMVFRVATVSIISREEFEGAKGGLEFVLRKSDSIQPELCVARTVSNAVHVKVTSDSFLVHRRILDVLVRPRLIELSENDRPVPFLANATDASNGAVQFGFFTALLANRVVLHDSSVLAELKHR